MTRRLTQCSQQFWLCLAIVLAVVACAAPGPSKFAAGRHSTSMQTDQAQQDQIAHGRFLIVSERDGWQHIYLYGRDGTLMRRLTSGTWEADRIQHVDEKAGYVYFTGTAEAPTA